MANNLLVGPNVAIAKQDKTFVDAGVTASVASIVYEVGAQIKSFVPGRSINGITGFINNKGYYIVMLQAVDWSAFLIPPITTTDGGGGTVTEVFATEFATEFQ